MTLASKPIELITTDKYPIASDQIVGVHSPEVAQSLLSSGQYTADLETIYRIKAEAEKGEQK